MDPEKPEDEAINIARRDLKDDGKIIVTFLNNNLEARGDFFPPEGYGAPVTEEYLKNTLESYSIVHGIQHDEIKKAYTECLDGAIVRNVLLARGEAPVNEIPEYLQMNPHLGKSKEEMPQRRAVDHRARSPFIIVKKDQVLAKLREKRPGKDGMNVLGEPVNFQVITPDGVSAGENTRMEGNLLLASISGQLLETKKELSVSDSLVIKGSVSYNTGNIIFPGDVEIHGTVSDGFKIYAGGSVNIRQTFDVTDSVVKKDLSVAGGIIGRGQAMVKVGGNLRTKFVENCRVACRKTVTVDLEIINSNIYTMEKIEMSEKGRIVGGEIYAFQGIRTGGIGKKAGKATRIHCGVDFAQQQEKEKNNSILKMLAAKITRLKELIDSEEGEKKEKMEALLAKLFEEQGKAQAKISEILGTIDHCWDTSLEVTGEIVPGTLIEICQTALFVTEPLKNVKITFSRGLGKLVTENL
ncbi:MAG: FapA family protein [Treponema sp.]|nr:FapA family protein [Treponema sp.]